MPFVLDASTAAAWAFEDEANPYPNRVLSMLLGDIAWVPSIWPMEMANAFLSGERRATSRQPMSHA